MATNLQLGAMTVGDILDRGLRMLLRRFPAVYLINLACQLPILVLLACIAFLSFDVVQKIPFIALIVKVLVLPICMAATVHIVDGEFKGQSNSAGAALAVGFSRFLPLLGTTILFGICLFAGVFLVAIPAGMISVPLGAPAGVIVAVVLVMAVALRIFVWACFFAQVTVVERAGGMYALNRSGKLGRGYGWRIFGVLLLFALINVFAQVVGEVISRLLNASETVFSAEAPYRQVVVYDQKLFAVAQIIEFLVDLVASCYISICTTMLYFDLRIRKEGYDLSVAAEQAEASNAPVLRPVEEDVGLKFPSDSAFRSDDLR